jgi:murein DD-endopeptidase MepM/ murein hydrolase activator NlpD
VDGAWVVPLVITARFGQGGEALVELARRGRLGRPLGRPVLAAAGGQVTFAGWDGPYGQRVEIMHLDGTKTWYAHLSTITVDDGAFVAAGETVGLVGSTGNSTGPHLHYEVHPGGVPTDPVPWMAARGAPL